MAIVTRAYLFDGNVTASMVERYLPAPLAGLKVTNLQTACVVEYDDTVLVEADVDAAMAVFGYVPGPSSTVTVRSLADFPTPVAGVITLADNTAYEIQGTVNITPNVLLMGSGTTIVGRSPATDQIHSHQPSAVVQVNAPAASNASAILESVQLVNGVGDCVDFQGDAFVSMVQCGVAGASAGRVAGVTRFAFADSVVQSIGAGFRLEGNIGSCIFTRMFAYNLSPGMTLVQALAPATFGILHFGDANLELTDPTTNGFDLDEAVVAAGSAAGVVANMFIGAGTPLVSGAGKADPATSPSPPWLFRSNVGIADTP